MSQQLYQCSECGLHYHDEATARACEAFCRQHKACSLEIASQAVENQPGEPASGSEDRIAP